jgi:hypothetical protein
MAFIQPANASEVFRVKGGLKSRRSSNTAVITKKKKMHAEGE